MLTTADHQTKHTAKATMLNLLLARGAGVTTINIKSTKRIKAGSEIFVTYGVGYWK